MKYVKYYFYALLAFILDQVYEMDYCEKDSAWRGNAQL